LAFLGLRSVNDATSGVNDQRPLQKRDGRQGQDGDDVLLATGEVVDFSFEEELLAGLACLLVRLIDNGSPVIIADIIPSSGE